MASGPRVLVIDDDHDMLVLVASTLCRAGFTVAATAPGGHEALDLAEQLRPPPDVVLLDYRMPGMDGLVCASALRDRWPHPRLVLFTSECLDGDLPRRAAECGIEQVISKRELFVLPQRLRELAS